MNRPSRTRLAAVAGALLLSATAVGSAIAADSSANAPLAKEPALTGSAKMYRHSGDTVHFAFDAHGAGEKAQGTFRFSHRFVQGGGASAEGRIDCLLSGGKVAVATGIVTKTDKPGLKGKRVGFTVSDEGKGRRDRLGYSWAATNDPVGMKEVPKCLSSAPYEIVETGDFQVARWEPQPLPRG
ncbi:Repetin [Streptomyces triculaminicus]|uniref:Repetin n=2 Tax=Streptomyces TaxID=1883 RepID=A0A939FLN5_9ACTN|nr:MULTISPECIES: hypothetical protein [Streptomyces]MBO0653537.1 Repetin [Streptomyces triculaminicus]QSY48388.1 Repetin [Streptomyces griseocarneus]